jgi:hypothetical protein
MATTLPNPALQGGLVDLHDYPMTCTQSARYPPFVGCPRRRIKPACAFHAGQANARSIGVEMCNPELPERNDPKDPRPVGALEVTNAGAAGSRRAVLGFYPRQVDAAIALARAIANLFHIPLVLPKATSPTSTAGVTRGFDPRVAQGNFRGICGHYHLKATKIDPGVSLWQPMRDAGFGVG